MQAYLLTSWLRGVVHVYNLPCKKPNPKSVTPQYLRSSFPVILEVVVALVVVTLLLQISPAQLVVGSATDKPMTVSFINLPALHCIGQILTIFNIDADRPEVRAVEHALVGAGEARDGRPVDVVLEQTPLRTLIRDVGPRGNRSWDT